MVRDVSTSFDIDDEDIYTLSEHDALGILRSTGWVVEQGEYVWIDQEGVERLAALWTQEGGVLATPLGWYDRYHFNDGSERTVNWLLLLDALNFCFWPEKDHPRWSIEYKGEVLNGYWAEAAALTRAMEEGLPLWDASYLSTISEETMAYVFRGNERIPLFEQRVANAREVGKILVEHFDGQFTRAIEQEKRDAVQLVSLLATTFPSFHDVALYRGHEVRFFKRAQICLADLFGAFRGEQWGALTQLDQLTIFADYKLPQVLRHYNVLHYDPVLADRIDRQELIDAGSEEEIEIRAATVWAAEFLRRALRARGHTIDALEIDQRLWLLSQKTEGMQPYHRTRTMYY